jgi:hypothetical protein
MQALGAGLPGSGVRAGSSRYVDMRSGRDPAQPQSLPGIGAITRVLGAPPARLRASSARRQRVYARLRRAASAFTRVFDALCGKRLGTARKRRLPVVGYGRYATVRYGMIDDRRVGS